MFAPHELVAAVLDNEAKEAAADGNVVSDEDVKVAEPMPPRVREEGVGIGAGGCFASSMNLLGAFGGKPMAMIKSLLNAQIDTVWSNAREKDPEARREDYGVKDNYWHIPVILATLKQFYGNGNFTFKKLRSTDLYSPESYQRGKTYILDGILGPRYFCPVDEKWVPIEDNHTFREDSPEWRHSVALLPDKKGEHSHWVLSRGLPGNRDPIDIMYLGEPTAAVAENKRFLLRILKAFEVQFPDMRDVPRPPPRVETNRKKPAKKRKKKAVKKRATTKARKIVVDDEPAGDDADDADTDVPEDADDDIDIVS